MSARVKWREREPRIGWDVSFTPLGGRLRSEEKLEEVDFSEEVICRFRSQAMIAVTPAESNSIDPDVLFFCSIARKILQRGELPPVPTEVEIALKKLITPLRAMSKEEMITAVIGPRKSINLDLNIKLDPMYESPFWEMANKKFPSTAAFLTCQAPFEALTEPTDNEHWVDYLLYSPWDTANPRVIEIDGDHKELAIDKKRDQTLKKFNVHTSRIKGADWHSFAMNGFEDNAKKTPKSKFSLKNAQSLFGPSISTRLATALIELMLRGHFPKRADIEIILEDDLQIGAELLLPILNFLFRLEALWGIAVMPQNVTCGHVYFLLSKEGYLPSQKKVTKGKKLGVSLQQYVSHQAELEIQEIPYCIIRGAFLPVNLEFLPFVPTLRRHLNTFDDESSVHLRRIMTDLFGHKSFRENQSKAILLALSGKDSLALLPTGSGKSLIYQMVGLLQPGTTLVVDPLTALIDDQIRHLNIDGINRALPLHMYALNAKAAKDNAYFDLSNGNSLFVFLSPERLQNSEFRAAIKILVENYLINTAVLDEAHCISEWGHDFRTAYLNVARNLRRICRGSNVEPPTILSLTGTASPAVLRDVVREIKDPEREIEIVRPESYDRPNLNYLISRGSTDNVYPRLSEMLLQSLPANLEQTSIEMMANVGDSTSSGIVFVPTIPTMISTQEHISTILRNMSGLKEQKTHGNLVGIFSSTPPKGILSKDWNNLKNKAAHDFISNASPILVATKAFGMGIDKPNIRWTIHLGFPSSLESFAQESGRAGRDGKKSLCVILASPASKDEARQVLDLSISPEERYVEYQKFAKRGKDDLFQQLYFHHTSFSGVNREIDEVMSLLQDIDPSKGMMIVKIPFTSPNENGKEINKEAEKEKAIYRLTLLGIIDDYTKQWNDKQFTLKLTNLNRLTVDNAFLDFMRRLEPGTFERQILDLESAPTEFVPRIRRHLTILIGAIYKTIEPARIRALIEIQQLCSTPISNEEIRTRILAYLSGGPLATALEEIAETTHLVVSRAIANLNAIPSVEAEEWIGASARQLETYPDNPMLLAARGIGENGRLEPNIELLRNTLEATFAAMPKYNIDQQSAAEVLMWLDEKIQGQIERPIDDDYEALSDAWEKSDFELEPLLVWEQEVFKRALTSDRWHNQLIRIGGRRLARRTEDLDSLVTRLKG